MTALLITFSWMLLIAFILALCRMASIADRDLAALARSWGEESF